MPFSPYIRSKKFVQEEWKTYFAPRAVKPADTVEAGWRGVLYANLAIIDPKAAWNFFAKPGFDYGFIDGGATRTWYLAFIAGKYIRFYMMG